MIIELTSPVDCSTSLIDDNEKIVAVFFHHQLLVEADYITTIVECDRFRSIVLRNGEKFMVTNSRKDIYNLLSWKQPTLWQQLKGKLLENKINKASRVHNVRKTHHR